MLRGLKTRLASFLRAQVDIVTTPKLDAVLVELPKLEAVLAELPKLDAVLAELGHLREIVGEGHSRIGAILVELRTMQSEFQTIQKQNSELLTIRAIVDQNIRSMENERSDMDETQRMVAIVCARVENFLKVQKEHSAVMEQSVASLLPNHLRFEEKV